MTETRRRPARERLLEAADQLMFVDGVVLTPVDEILRRAGASPSTLYANFGNKDGLIGEALERRLVEWTASWDEAIAAADGPIERLLAIFPALSRYQHERLHERWCAFSGTAAATPGPSDPVRSPLQAEDDLLRQRMHDFSVEVVGEGRAEELADHVTITYFGALVGMLRRDQDRAIVAGERTARAVIEAMLAEGDS